MEAAAVSFKQRAVDAAMAIDHAQTTPDRKVVIAENIRPLQAEQQDHLRRPDADAAQAAQRADSLRIVHTADGLQIERAIHNSPGKVREILGLAERHAKGLQRGYTGGKDRFGTDSAERVLHALPDRGLRLHGDLLADDVVHDGGKQIRVHRALHRPDTVDDRSQPLVLPAQIRQLGLAVDKIHQPHLLMGLL